MLLNVCASDDDDGWSQHLMLCHLNIYLSVQTLFKCITNRGKCSETCKIPFDSKIENFMNMHVWLKWHDNSCLLWSKQFQNDDIWEDFIKSHLNGTVCVFVIKLIPSDKQFSDDSDCVGKINKIHSSISNQSINPMHEG